MKTSNNLDRAMLRKQLAGNIAKAIVTALLVFPAGGLFCMLLANWRVFELQTGGIVIWALFIWSLLSLLLVLGIVLAMWGLLAKIPSLNRYF